MSDFTIRIPKYLRYKCKDIPNYEFFKCNGMICQRLPITAEDNANHWITGRKLNGELERFEYNQLADIISPTLGSSKDSFEFSIKDYDQGANGIGQFKPVMIKTLKASSLFIVADHKKNRDLEYFDYHVFCLAEKSEDLRVAEIRFVDLSNGDLFVGHHNGLVYEVDKQKLLSEGVLQLKG